MNTENCWFLHPLPRYLRATGIACKRGLRVRAPAWLQPACLSTKHIYQKPESKDSASPPQPKYLNRDTQAQRYQEPISKDCSFPPEPWYLRQGYQRAQTKLHCGNCTKTLFGAHARIQFGLYSNRVLHNLVPTAMAQSLGASIRCPQNLPRH